jgi:hypothetical protein
VLPPHLVKRLALAEPYLLTTPLAALEARYADILASTGSFAEDAAGMVLADPRILLQLQPCSSARQGAGASAAEVAGQGGKAGAKDKLRTGKGSRMVSAWCSQLVGGFWLLAAL